MGREEREKYRIGAVFSNREIIAGIVDSRHRVCLPGQPGAGRGLRLPGDGAAGGGLRRTGGEGAGD